MCTVPPAGINKNVLKGPTSPAMRRKHTAPAAGADQRLHCTEHPLIDNEQILIKVRGKEKEDRERREEANRAADGRESENKCERGEHPETGPICAEQQGINRRRGRKRRDGEGVRGGGRSAEMWNWA